MKSAILVLSLGHWPYPKLTEVVTSSNTELPITVFADTNGRFIVRYSDELGIRTFTTQRVIVEGTGLVILGVIIDTEVDGRITFRINDDELISFEESEGRVVRIKTTQINRPEIEIAAINPNLGRSNNERMFLMLLLCVKKNIAEFSTDVRSLSFWLIGLLLAEPSLTDIVAGELEEKVSFKVVEKELSESDLTSAIDYWKIDNSFLTNRAPTTKNRVEFLAHSIGRVRGHLVSIEQVILSFINNDGNIALPNADNSLQKPTISYAGRSSLDYVLKEIAISVLQAMNPIVLAINNRG